MNINYTAKRNLIPALMEWVAQSRIKPHLVDDTRLIMLLDDALYINLSNLSLEYQHKFIEKDFRSYSKMLLVKFCEQLHKWAAEYAVSEIEFKFIFTCQKERFEVKKTIKVQRDDIARRNFLDNKTT